MHYCHYLDKKCVAYLAEALTEHVDKNPHFSQIAVICIGTNHCAGDSLGPMVGTRLTEQWASDSRITIYGSLDKPVHALNLHETMEQLDNNPERPLIIAVDACLGQFYKIGTIQFVDEPLKPGAGLYKQLPDVGHVHLKGIINNHGPLNQKVLEHTSLTFVSEMSVVISRILTRAFQTMIPLLKPARQPCCRK